MSRPHPSTRLLAVLSLSALAAGGCATGTTPPAGGPSWSAANYTAAAGGADLGPLTDARGRRRSLALAPAGVRSQGGPYAARNDTRRGVTAGYRSATYRTAQTTTVDRGPGGGGGFYGHRHGHGLRDGYSTRTVRRSYTEVVR